MPNGAAAEHWISISALAKLRGVRPQTISERVQRLVRDGKLEVRPGRGRERLVNSVAFEEAVGATADFARVQSAATRKAALADGGNYTTAQTRKVGFESELRRIELEEKLGGLVAWNDVRSSSERVAAGLVDIIEGVPRSASDIASEMRAVGAVIPPEAEQKLKERLKDVVRRTRQSCADWLTTLAAEKTGADE
jgi:hypothetical protein